MSNRLRSIIAALMLAVSMVTGATVLAPPAAAASCYGDYCSGRDPQATGCSAGSYTVAYTQAYFNRAFSANQQYAGLLELRWSPTCKTNWARFTTQASISYTLTAIQRETGYAQRQDAGKWQSAWTNQIYSPSKCVSAVLDVKWDPGYANPTTVTTVCI